MCQLSGLVTGLFYDNHVSRNVVFFELKFLFMTIILHIIYIPCILMLFSDFFNQFWSCSGLGIKNGDTEMCDVILAYCDVIFDT